jgi:hypothetical protein
MKTNGATWKAYLDSWPEGQWFDDSDEMYDGKAAEDLVPADSAEVEVTCGVIFRNEQDREGMDLVPHFRRWLKAQTHTSLVVQIPKEQEAALAAFLKTIQGKAV